MPLTTTTEIPAPASRVWAILTDTEAWTVWGPSVNRVECDVRFITAGTRGRVRTALGIWLPFEIHEFADQRYWRWRVSGIPATGHRVDPLGGESCRLSFEVPTLAAAYLPICRIACRRIRELAVSPRG